jgi:hypothetical protein
VSRGRARGQGRSFGAHALLLRRALVVGDDRQHRAHLRLVLEDPPRLSLETDSTGGPDLPMHRGLRIVWIEDALAPLRGQIPEDQLERLIYGIGATLGIEAFVWLTDIARVPRDEAAAIMRSNASGLLQSAMPKDALTESA